MQPEELKSKFNEAAVSKISVDNLEILELLGRGGMSEVYRARQKDLDRIVAVKILLGIKTSSAESIQRFQNEARLTSSLKSPNIVKVMSFGVSNEGHPYLVMEFVNGRSLAEEIKILGKLPLERFRAVFLPLLTALEEAHAYGLVHRDIKPSNIMLCKDDAGNDAVKLVDFGIAKVVEGQNISSQQLTKTGAILGSPLYISPEQCSGRPVDARSDLYSLSCVMYEALKGEPPFQADSTLEVMSQHLRLPPPAVKDFLRAVKVDEALARAVLWGLAKDPNDRPQSAAVLRARLDSVLASNLAVRSSRPKQNAINLNSRLMLLLLIALSLGIGGYYFYGKMKSNSEKNRSVLSDSSKMKFPVDVRGAALAIQQGDGLVYSNPEKALRKYELAIEKLRGLNRNRDLWLAYVGAFKSLEGMRLKCKPGSPEGKALLVQAQAEADLALEQAKMLKQLSNYSYSCLLRVSTIFELDPSNAAQSCSKFISEAGRVLGPKSADLIDLEVTSVIKLTAMQLSRKNINDLPFLRAMAEESLELAKDHQIAKSFPALRASMARAYVYMVEEKKEEALKIADEVADDLFKNSKVTENIARATILEDLFRLYSWLGCYQKFEPLVEREFSDGASIDSPRIGMICRRLGDACLADAKPKEAAKCYVKVRQLLEASLDNAGMRDEYIHSSRQLVQIYHASGQDALVPALEADIKLKTEMAN